MVSPRVGVLALQGDFREHRRLLHGMGVATVEVRTTTELGAVDGLVIPGGESTTLMHLMASTGIDAAVRGFDRPLLGTCAGMIVLDQAHLGRIDIDVERNAYGRQAASFETDLLVSGDTRPLHAVFIRAPRVSRVGKGVEVLAEHDGVPVLLTQDSIIVAAFHPELSGDPRIHRRFMQLVEKAELQPA